MKKELTKRTISFLISSLKKSKDLQFESNQKNITIKYPQKRATNIVIVFLKLNTSQSSGKKVPHFEFYKLNPPSRFQT